jgi:hypothetical protein
LIPLQWRTVEYREFKIALLVYNWRLLTTWPLFTFLNYFLKTVLSHLKIWLGYIVNSKVELMLDIVDHNTEIK